MKRLLIIEVAGLGYTDCIKNQIKQINSLEIKESFPIFPALTCPVQATVRTALYPSNHKVLFNGVVIDDLKKISFWEQSASIVKGERIWKKTTAHGSLKTAMLFWQQSLGEDLNYCLSPLPVHRHSGGTIENVYSYPQEIYTVITNKIKSKFRLRYYWGPMASPKAGEWISKATSTLIEVYKPDICFTYIPSLDYDFQRFGPYHSKSIKALSKTVKQLEFLVKKGLQMGYEIFLFGDYVIENVSKPIFINKILRKRGLIRIQNIKGKEYIDLYTSPCFAIADHQLAYMCVWNKTVCDEIKKILYEIPLKHIIKEDNAQEFNLALPSPIMFILVAEENCWFDYRWWLDDSSKPDFASHVDIHRKPGYDPCELLTGWPPWNISLNPFRIHGSHGKNDKPIAIATTLPELYNCKDLCEIVCKIKNYLNTI